MKESNDRCRYSYLIILYLSSIGSRFPSNVNTHMLDDKKLAFFSGYLCQDHALPKIISDRILSSIGLISEMNIADYQINFNYEE